MQYRTAEKLQSEAKDESERKQNNTSRRYGLGPFTAGNLRLINLYCDKPSCSTGRVASRSLTAIRRRRAQGIQGVESSIRFKSDHWASHDLCCSACMVSDNVPCCHHLGRLTSIRRRRQSDELAWTTSDNEGNRGPAFAQPTVAVEIVCVQ